MGPKKGSAWLTWSEDRKRQVAAEAATRGMKGMKVLPTLLFPSLPPVWFPLFGFALLLNEWYFTVVVFGPIQGRVGCA